VFESPKQSDDYFFALAAGFAAGVFADLAAPAFALVDLAAPAFAFVDFGAGAAGATFAVVVFAVVAFAAVLFAAIPDSSVENCSTDFKCRMFVGTSHEQPRMQTAAGLTRPACNNLTRVIGDRRRMRQA